MAEVKRLTVEEFENLPWLHVYPQYTYHGDLKIVGNASAFRALAAALLSAADTGKAETEASVIDGEGYRIVIERTNTTGLRLTSLPYTAEWCRDLRYQSQPLKALLADCYMALHEHYHEAQPSYDQPPEPADEWSYNIVPLFVAIQRATGMDHDQIMLKQR